MRFVVAFIKIIYFECILSTLLKKLLWLGHVGRTCKMLPDSSPQRFGDLPWTEPVLY